MEYPTASTVWPVPAPGQDVRKLLNLFLTLVDSKVDDSGDRLANEVFTRDGEFMLAHATFRGTSEIKQSRKNAWETVQMRRHTIRKVYANNASGLDLIVIGALEMATVKGDTMDMQFVARTLIKEEDGGARIQLYRVLVPQAQAESPILAV